MGVGRAEERFGRGGAPVHQQPAPGVVAETESADVHGLGIVGADHPPEAQVEAETAQDGQPGGQPVDGQVSLDSLLTLAAGGFSLRIEPRRQLCNRLLDGQGKKCEILAVDCDQPRGGLVGKVRREVEHSGRPGVRVVRAILVSISCPLQFRFPLVRPISSRRAILRHHRGLAASPPVRYMLRVEGQFRQAQGCCVASMMSRSRTA